MTNTFPKITRINLHVPPVDWELQCMCCNKVYKGFSEINRGFQPSFSLYALVEHSVYCEECIPEMLSFIQNHIILNKKITDSEKIHMCTRCWLISIGEEAIKKNVFPRSDAKSGYQSRCKTCGREDMDSIFQYN